MEWLELMRHLAVVGSPIDHSLSPTIHRAAYERLGIAFDYRAIEVGESGLDEFFATRTPSWLGISITMPLKRMAAARVEPEDDLVMKLGVCNTIRFEWRGDHPILHGYNTDVDGMVRAISTAIEQDAAITDALILGSGATAESALVAAARLGATRATIGARRTTRLDVFIELGRWLGVDVTMADLAEAPAIAKTADLVISTLPAHAADALALRPGNGGTVLLDVVYNPRFTALISSWTQGGGNAVGGASMLVFQAVGQIRIFTSADPTAPLAHESSVIRAMVQALPTEAGSQT